MNRDDEDKKKEEIRLKRKSNSLRKIVLEARQRWEESIKKNILFCYIDKGESERSPQKTIYFIRPGINWNKVKKEREKLEARIARTDKRVLGSSRSLWLPTVIENAEKITISIYDAASTKNISLDKAQEFLAKAKLEGVIDKEAVIDTSKKYFIRAQTGRGHEITVETLRESESVKHTCTNWLICLCSRKMLPILERNRVRSKEPEDRETNLVCSHGKKKLYFHLTSETNK
jgi:hypothetical protein